MTTSARMFEKFMDEIGLGFALADLPGPDTPLPPTNATLHILARDEAYGTPQRRLVMLCGVSWLTRESTGEHKWVGRDEEFWHKHVNCDACLKTLAEGK